MARHDRGTGHRPEASQPPQPPPVPVVASPSAAAPLPPPAPPVEPLVAPPAAPLRLVALTSIHGGRIYAPGDEIPASIAAQLSEGEHWHRAP
ncbi:MAG: hypothetical protein IPQ09_25125 [Myxococcales bacterium]|nr:hypothetical protein [Myxococcales bacterium]